MSGAGAPAVRPQHVEVRVEEKQGDREEVDQEAAVRSFGEMQTEVDRVCTSFGEMQTEVDRANTNQGQGPRRLQDRLQVFV